MVKIKKTAIVTIRMSPAEKQATVDLADRLGIDISDVVRLSIREVLKQKDGSNIFNLPDMVSAQGGQNG